MAALDFAAEDRGLVRQFQRLGRRDGADLNHGGHLGEPLAKSVLGLVAGLLDRLLALAKRHADSGDLAPENVLVLGVLAFGKREQKLLGDT